MTKELEFQRALVEANNRCRRMEQEAMLDAPVHAHQNSLARYLRIVEYCLKRWPGDRPGTILVYPTTG